METIERTGGSPPPAFERLDDPLLRLGRHPLAGLAGRAPERLPADQRRDVRGEWLGCREAAEIVGVKRTQMWRIASAGKVACLVMGSPRRPEYKFQREVVERFAREWRTRKTLQKLARTHNSFRLMQELARQHRLSPALTAILQEQRRRAGRPKDAPHPPAAGTRLAHPLRDAA